MPVFPYRTFSIGKPNIDLAKRTFAVRSHKENRGWQQNSIQAAYLGLTDETKKMVVESFSNWDKNFRFPAFWGPNYDWTPDQDHGTVAMNALAANDSFSMKITRCIYYLPGQKNGMCILK
jgi:hypothetical protein